MAVTDDQFELLESYLDGELPSEQEGALLARLAAEPELAAAMDSIRAERDVRSAVWQAYEPDENSVQRLVMKVEAAVDRDVVWARRFAKFRIPSALAACIMVGFLVGWMGRGKPVAPLGDPGSAVAVNANNAAPGVMTAPVAGGTATAGMNPLVTTVKASTPVELPLVNEYGQQVGVQRFASAEEAARFIEDCNNWQKNQEKVKSGNVTLTGAEKF